MGYPESQIGLAVAKKIILQNQAEKLLQFFVDLRRKKLSTAAGACGAVAILAVFGAFNAALFELFGGKALFTVSAVYGIILAFISRILLVRRKKRTQGGIAALIAVFMVPFAVCGLEQIIGLWPEDLEIFQGYHFWLYGSWLVIELATAGAGLIVLAFVRFSFLLIPVLLALWHFAMDTSAIIAQQPYTNFESGRIGSVVYGIILILVAWIIDRRSREDFSFWAYLFGGAALLGGLSSMEISGSLQGGLFMLISLISIPLAFYLERRLFFIFGIIGVFGGMSFILSKIFADSTVLAFCVLSAAAVTAMTILLFIKNETSLYASFERMIPAALRGAKPRMRKYGYLCRR